MSRGDALGFALFVVLISFVWATPAYAYVDPSTGGQLFQLLAVIFTLLSGILLFLSAQVRGFLARARRRFRELIASGSARGGKSSD